MASSPADVVEQQAEAKAETALENTATQAGVRDNPSQIRKELLDKLSETDLRDTSRDLLRNMLTADWVFANLDGDDYREISRRIESRKLAFKDAHPHPESEVVGKDRAYINETDDYLKPLTPTQKMQTDHFFDGVRLRLTRSKNMQQQRVLQTSIVESSVSRDARSDSSGRDGLLSRWFGQ